MTNPLDDNSRWTVLASRCETPQFLADGLRQLMREAYGDEMCDALEASVPPPYGTLGFNAEGTDDQRS